VTQPTTLSHAPKQRERNKEKPRKQNKKFENVARKETMVRRMKARKHGMRGTERRSNTTEKEN
jgi:hypothetical protein